MFRYLATSLVLMAAMAMRMPAMAAEHTAQHTSEMAVEAGGAEAPTVAHGEHQVIEFDPVTAIWVLIIFAVLLIALYPTAWKNVLAGLKQREERIRKDIADAEAARTKAEATLKEYAAQLATAEEKVRQMITSATADGEKIAAQIRARGQQEAEEARQRAVRDIDAASKLAVSEIYAKAADLSTSIAAKILRRNINADDQQDLVRESVRQMQESDAR